MSATFPLTSFERFLLRQEHPAYPSSCFVGLRFSGQIQRDAFDSAVRTALGRHPLLAAMVEPGPANRSRFVTSEDPEPIIEWMRGPRPNGFPTAAYTDLTRGSGLRVRVWVGAQATDIVLQYHHATSDAFGVMWFIYDVLLGYRAAVGRFSPRYPPLSGTLVEQRGRLGLTWWTRLAMAPGQVLGLFGVWQYLSRTVQPILPYRPDRGSPLPPRYPAVITHVLDERDTIGLTRAAERSGSTVNDLLARDLFQVLSQWRTRAGVGHDDDWLRIMVPVNLRTARLRRLSAANAAGAVFLDRRQQQCHDPRRLLESIHREMRVIARFKLAYSFIWTIGLVGASRVGHRVLTKTDRCVATCVLTNLGKIPRSPLSMEDGRITAGDLVLDDLELVAPVWPQIGASFATIVYGGRLFITLHHDSRVVPPAVAGDLLAAYGARLRGSIGTAEASRRPD